MRVLHVDTEKRVRGGEIQLLFLVEGLKKRGVYSAVACRKGSDLEKVCNEKKIDVYPLIGNQIVDAVFLVKVAKNFDIVHAHTAKALNICAFSKVFHRKPVVFTRGCDFPPRKNFFTKKKYELTDAVVVVAKKIKPSLEKYVSSNIKLIYPCIPDEVQNFVDWKKAETFRNKFKNKKIIGTASALEPEKNISNLIKSAKILLKKRKDIVFVVFGEGSLRRELEKMIKNYGIEENFFLEGFKKDIHNYVKSLDVFVLSSDSEGFGSALLFPMILKVPVVATDVGGIPEVVIHKKTGILVERRNPQELAGAIEELLENQELRRTLTENAFKHVKENFVCSKTTSSYLKLYEEVLSRYP